MKVRNCQFQVFFYNTELSEIRHKELNFVTQNSEFSSKLNYFFNSTIMTFLSLLPVYLIASALPAR